MKDRKNLMRDYFARNRVSYGLLLGSGVLIFLRPIHHPLVIAGLSVSFIGVFIRSWAAGCIKKSKSLCTSGPYAMVRHPLYLGSLLMSMGIGVAFTCAETPWLSSIFWITYTLYFWSFYSAAITNEEKLLSERFSGEWTVYREQVSAFIPFRFTSFRQIFLSSFSWAQYSQNKEYNAVLGWAGTVALVLFLYSPFACKSTDPGLKDILATQERKALPISEKPVTPLRSTPTGNCRSSLLLSNQS